MRDMTAMRTFGDWVADGAEPPAPANVGTVFPLSEARPVEWPESAPWLTTARHAVSTEARELVFFARADGSLIEELRAALPTVGLKAVPVPFPFAPLPMDILVCSPSGERSSTGRLVVFGQGRDARGTSCTLGALVRP